MGIELGYLTLCNMPVDVNATSPVPLEGEGSIIWSTLIKEVLRWDGGKWTIHGPQSFFATTRPSIRPSLLLAFGNSGVMDHRITFSRSGPAACYDRTGTLTTVAANVPRIDYDPVTLECKGLLIEEARTNLMLYSNDPTNGIWAKTNNGLGSTPVLTANYGLAPDGTLTATRVQLKLNGGSTSTDWSRLHQSVNISSGVAYSNSIYVKTVDGSTKTLQFRDDSANVNAASTLVAVDGNWQRLTASATSTGTVCNAGSIWLRGAQGTSDSADLLVWGAQLEVGSYPTSLIATTSSATTRPLETAVISTLSPWFNSREGTLYVEAESPGTTVFPGMVAIDDGTANNRTGIYFSGPGGYAASYYRNSGTAYISGSVTNARGSFAKVAMGMRTGNYMTVVNGTTATANNTGFVPTGSTRMVIGGGDNPLNGHIRRIAYYPARLSDQELITLTV